MIGKIIADTKTSIPYIMSDGSGGQPLVWADYDYGLSKTGSFSVDDVGDMLDE